MSSGQSRGLRIHSNQEFNGRLNCILSSIITVLDEPPCVNARRSSSTGLAPVGKTRQGFCFDSGQSRGLRTIKVPDDGEAQRATEA
jgi:hypothetical protein